MRTIFLMVMRPSNISGTSCSKSLSRNSGCRAGEDDDRAVVAHLHLGYDGPDGVAFAEEVARYLFALRKYQFVVLVVEHEYLLFPHLIDLARDYLAHAFAVLLEQVGFFEIEDAGGEVLAQRKHCAASERIEFYLVGHLFAHFVGFVEFAGVRNGYLLVGVLHLAVLHDDAVAPDFEVALVGIDDYVEVLIRFVSLYQQMAENILQYSYHRTLVDILKAP